jgi:hypothetical protein
MQRAEHSPTESRKFTTARSCTLNRSRASCCCSVSCAHGDVPAHSAVMPARLVHHCYRCQVWTCGTLLLGGCHSGLPRGSSLCHTRCCCGTRAGGDRVSPGSAVPMETGQAAVHCSCHACLGRLCRAYTQTLRSHALCWVQAQVSGAGAMPPVSAALPPSQAAVGLVRPSGAPGQCREDSIMQGSRRQQQRQPCAQSPPGMTVF